MRGSARQIERRVVAGGARSRGSVPRMVPVLVAVGVAAVLVALRFLLPPGLGAPLPVELRQDIDVVRGYAEKLIYPFTASGESGFAHVVFDNVNDKSVTAHWSFRKGDALPKQFAQVEPTAYLPTAVCKRAGSDRVLFVAGYKPRDGTVLIEKWTLPEVSLGVANPMEGEDPGSGPGHTLLLQGAAPLDRLPAITRDPVFESSVLQPMSPIADMACHPWGDYLLVLPLDDPQSLLTVDLATGTPVFLASISAFAPEFERSLSVRSGMHAAKGLVFVLHERPAWERPTPEIEASWMLVFEDQGLDGAFEYSDLIQRSAFSGIYDPAGWIEDYAAP